MSLTRTGRLLAFGACLGTVFAIQGCAGFRSAPALVVRDPPSDNPPAFVASAAKIESDSLPPAQVGAPANASKLVAPGGVVVGNGDTIYSVARENSVPIRELVDMNGLVAPYDVRPGQRLRLPPRAPTVAAASVYRSPAPVSAAASPTNSAAPPAVASAPSATPGPGVVRVESLPPIPGTAPSAAGAAPAGPAAASTAPSFSSEARILPASATETPLPEPEAKPAMATPGRGLENHDVAAATVPPTALPSASLPTPLPPPGRPSAASAVSAAIANEATAHAGPVFSWPIRGTIVSGYGSKKGGEHNDGINISAVRGEFVRAADDGVVAYAGNELRGFGNLVLIRHADGWTTAYAHNDTLLVRRGDLVKRGQVIARAGSTGSVATPQLHFEIRRGRRAVDPKEYLAAADEASPVSPVAARDARRDPE